MLIVLNNIFRKVSFPFYQQLESNDCGITCIRMICSFYGKDYSLNQIKGKCEITKLGISITDIIDCCKKIGINSLAIQSQMDKIYNRYNRLL